MTARDTFNSTVATATKTKVATDLQNEMIRQETINAAGVGVGYTLQAGNYAALAAAVKSAIAAKLTADLAAEQTKQASHAAARDTLRNSGDLAPF
jgi:hypothetical protein